MISLEKMKTAEGFELELWSIEKENEDGQHRTVTAPLHVVVKWAIGQNIITDLSDYMVRTVTNQVIIDLD